MADEASATAPPVLLPRWVQLFIVFPALGTSLFAAVPRVWEEVKALRLGVARSQLQLVEEQQRLWERNLDCLTHQGIWEVDGPEGLIVRVSLCKSGDILVRYHDNDWAPQLKWIARPARKKVDDATADAPPAAPAHRLRGSP